jgi:PAS domain S-box-containing protein
MKNQQVSRLSFVAFFSAIGLILLAGVVFILQYQHSLSFAPSDSFPYYNLAASLFLSGTALLAWQSWRPITGLFGFFTFILSAMVLIELLFGMPVSLDSLLMSSSLRIESVFDVRLAFYFSTGFFLASTIFIFNRYKITVPGSFVIVFELFSSIIIALGSLGVLSGISSWDHSREVLKDPLTYIVSSGLILLGSGLLARMLLFLRTRASRVAHLLPLLLGIGIILISMHLWNLLSYDESVHINRLMKLKSHSIMQEIRYDLRSKILSLVRMARRIEIENNLTYEEWASDALLNQIHNPGYEAIGVLDAAGQKTWAVPRRSIFDRMQWQTQQKDALESALTFRRVSTTPSFNLARGAKAFAVVVPIFGPSEFRGYVVGVIKINDTLNNVMRNEESLYSLTVMERDQMIYSTTLKDPPPAFITEESFFTLYDLNWKIKIHPTAKLIANTRSPLPEVALIVGMLLAILVSLLIYLGKMGSIRTKQLGAVNEKLESEIKERIHAEDRIRKSEMELAEAQRLAHIGSWTWSRTNRVLTWSDELYRIYGLTPGEIEISYDTFLDRVHPDDRDFVRRIIEIAYTEGKSFSLEHRILQPNGNVRTLLAYGHTVKNHAGQVMKMIGTGQDITARKQAEEALRREKEFSDLLIHNTVDGIMAYDRNFCFTAWNPGMERMTGFSREEVLGRNAFEVLPFLKEIGEERFFSEALSGKNAVSKDRLYKTDAAHQGFFDAYYAPLKNESGDIMGGLGIIHEISERKKSEKQFEELIRSEIARYEAEKSEKYFRTMADSVPVLIWMSGPDGKCNYFNKTWLEFTGKTQEEELGDGWAEGVHPEDLEECLNTYRTSFAAHETFRMEYRLKRVDGKYRWVLDTGVPLLDTNGKFAGFIGSCLDITERKEMEEALKHQTEELARSNSELGQFAYVASHDLQEPLRMVASYTQLLANRYKEKLDLDATEFITYATEGAIRAQQLVNDLLDYSRVETRGKGFTQVDCLHILEQAFKNLKLTIEETQAVITVDSLPTVTGDVTQLSQLFQNLLGNAIKFRKPGIPPQIHISAKEIKEGWLFSFKDNGIGIDKQYFDRIFIIFQRLHTKSAYPGTGIGLSICKKIVERHHGKIWVESTLGEGTTFYFTIKT